MALPSVIYKFALDISDVDRGVYETVELRVARHPSETETHAVMRVLCYALELQEGLTLGRGLGDPDDAALRVDDLTGRTLVWIDIGAPSADRLHRAAKRVDTVKVYTHKDPARVRANLAGGRAIHRVDSITLTPVPIELVEALAESLSRSNTWAILRSDGRVYVTVGDDTLEAELTESPLLG